MGCVGERVYELLLGNVYTSRDPIIVGEDDSDASQSLLPDDSPSLTSHRYIYPPVLEGKSWFYGGLQEVNPPPLSFRCILFKFSQFTTPLSFSVYVLSEQRQQQPGCTLASNKL